LESNELLKTLYKRINELSGNNIVAISNSKGTNEKTEKIKKDATKAEYIKEKEESNKALNSLVDKLIKKFDYEKQDELKIENDLVNTKLFKNLIKKFTVKNETDNEVGFADNKNAALNKIYQDEKIIKVFFYQFK
jgi:cupin superfamily acireductone dioxygenase involved in methionine salvage